MEHRGAWSRGIGLPQENDIRCGAGKALNHARSIRHINNALSNDTDRTLNVLKRNEMNPVAKPIKIGQCTIHAGGINLPLNDFLRGKILRRQIQALHRIAEQRFVGVKGFMANGEAHQVTES